MKRTIFFGTEDQPNGGRLMDWARFHFTVKYSIITNTMDSSRKVDFKALTEAAAV